MSEQFENSIRKKLLDAEIPFDPDAWEKMKKRLDNPRRRPAFFWWMLSGLLIFVAAGSFWWWNQQSNHPVVERVPVTDSIPSAEMQSTTVPSSGGELLADTPPGNVGQGANADEQNASLRGATRKTGIHSRNTDQDKPSSQQASSFSSTSQQAPPGITQSSVQQSTSSGAVKQPAAIAQQLSTQQNASSNTVEQSTITAQQNASSNTVKQSAITAQQNTSSNTNKPSAITTQQNTSSDTIRQSSPTAPQRDSLPQKGTRRGFEGGITIGPDVNIASSMKMGRIGLSTGIILRYHFNNRWSVQTGAIYTKKLYGATPEDYHFDYPVSYTKIDADCNVVDVPLNVSYMFHEGYRDRWSAVAGASSYFMLSEKYDYYYANGTKRSHEYKNQNQHFFSVLNLGLSWERQTAGRLRLALQPYVKVPLGGVGQGKVKLYSAGLALQVTMGKK